MNNKAEKCRVNIPDERTELLHQGRVQRSDTDKNIKHKLRVISVLHTAQLCLSHEDNRDSSAKEFSWSWCC